MVIVEWGKRDGGGDVRRAWETTTCSGGGKEILGKETRQEEGARLLGHKTFRILNVERKRRDNDTVGEKLQVGRRKRKNELEEKLGVSGWE